MEQTKPTAPILYFVEGEVPTNEEFAKAEQFMAKGPMFEFVSLANYDFNSELRPASGVAGKVPEIYKEYTVLDKMVAKAIEDKKSKPAAAE